MGVKIRRVQSGKEVKLIFKKNEVGVRIKSHERVLVRKHKVTGLTLPTWSQMQWGGS